jgi:DNA-binding response OmpR family regulator
MAGWRILLVDDDRDLVDALRLALEAHGYEVRTAADTQEAQQCIQAECPDLIVLDVMLNQPGEGIQFAVELKRDANLKHLPIVMLTSINRRFHLGIGREVEEGYLPVDRFLEKPVEPEQLLSAIKELLQVSV